jgi:hypothetical protein
MKTGAGNLLWPPFWFVEAIVGVRQSGAYPSVAAAALYCGNQARCLRLRQFASNTVSPDCLSQSVEI